MIGSKLCTKCGGKGPFSRSKVHSGGFYPSCKKCQNKYYVDWRKKGGNRLVHQTQVRWRKNNPEKYMLQVAKKRAKKAGLSFDIEVEDIVIPTHCPLLDIPLFFAYGKKTGGRNSPSLDRKDSKLGYVKGNVWVISHRANVLKRDATVEEIELLAKSLRLHLRKPRLVLVRKVG